MSEILFLSIGAITRKDGVPALEVYLDNRLIGYVIPVMDGNESYFKVPSMIHREVALAKSWFRELRDVCMKTVDITDEMCIEISKYVVQCIENLAKTGNFIIYYNCKILDRNELRDSIMIKAFALESAIYIKNNWR